MTIRGGHIILNTGVELEHKHYCDQIHYSSTLAGDDFAYFGRNPGSVYDVNVCRETHSMGTEYSTSKIDEFFFTI